MKGNQNMPAFHIAELRAVARNGDKFDLETAREKKPVTATSEKLEIDAAMAKPEMKSIKRLLASAHLTLEKRVSVHDLDGWLATSGLSSRERIQVKVGLDRAGLLI